MSNQDLINPYHQSDNLYCNILSLTYIQRGHLVNNHASTSRTKREARWKHTNRNQGKHYETTEICTKTIMGTTS